MKEGREKLISRYWFDTISRFKSSPSELKVWWALPFMNHLINEPLTGRKGYYYWSWFKDKYIDQPLERGLSLGWGMAASRDCCRKWESATISMDTIYHKSF